MALFFCGVQGGRPDGISSAGRVPDAAVRAGLVAHWLHGLPSDFHRISHRSERDDVRRGASYLMFGREWYERRTGEFNALHPTISVTVKHVSVDDMVNGPQTDLEEGTNFYRGYLVPSLVHGGLSLLAGRLMEMSSFTVANVNSISWPSIGRFFPSHASLYEGKVLSLPLSGTFVSLCYRQDTFRDYEVAVDRTLEGVRARFSGFERQRTSTATVRWTAVRASRTLVTFPVSFRGLDQSDPPVSWDVARHHSRHGHSCPSLAEPCGAGGHETLEAGGWSSRDDRRYLLF